MKTYDIVVLGLGVMGSAAALSLAKRGVSVLGVDAHGPHHAGSLQQHHLGDAGSLRHRQRLFRRDRLRALHRGNTPALSE